MGPATQFSNMSQNCQELLAIKGIRSQGLSPPKFIMETRKFTIVHSNTNLSSQLCEVEIVCALNVPIDLPSKQTTQCVRTAVTLNLAVSISLTLTVSNPTPRRGSSSRSQSSVSWCSAAQYGRPRMSSLVKEWWPLRHWRQSVRQACVCIWWTRRVGRKPSGGMLKALVRLREPLTGESPHKHTTHIHHIMNWFAFLLLDNNTCVHAHHAYS